MKAAIALLLMMFLIFPAAAQSYYEKVKFERVKNFNFDVTQVGTQYSIVSVYLEDIKDFNSTQTVVLNAYGKIYVITIKSSEKGVLGAYKVFNVSLMYPNGSVVYKQIEVPKPFASDYDVMIQYWVPPEDALAQIDVNLYIGGLLNFEIMTFRPEDATFIFDLSNYLLFNNVQGTSTAEMNVVIYYTTEQSWKNEVNTSKSPIPPFQTDPWMLFLTIISKIPVVGQYIADALYLMGVIVGETFYFVKLILVDNWELTVLTYESFAMMYAMQSRSLARMFGRYITFHVETFKLLFVIIVETISLLFRLIQAVGSLLPFT